MNAGYKGTINKSNIDQSHRTLSVFSKLVEYKSDTPTKCYFFWEVDILMAAKNED